MATISAASHLPPTATPDDYGNSQLTPDSRHESCLAPTRPWRCRCQLGCRPTRPRTEDGPACSAPVPSGVQGVPQGPLAILRAVRQGFVLVLRQRELPACARGRAPSTRKSERVSAQATAL